MTKLLSRNLRIGVYTPSPSIRRFHCHERVLYENGVEKNIKPFPRSKCYEGVANMLRGNWACRTCYEDATRKLLPCNLGFKA